MKKFYKIMLSICCITSILGIMLTVAGVLMGGAGDLESDAKNNRLVIGMGNTFSDVEDDNEDTKNMTPLTDGSITFLTEEVASVDLNVKNGEVEISSWENDYYEVKGVSNTNKIRYSLENGVLKVRTKGSTVTFWKRWRNGVKAVIYIPKRAENINMKIMVGAGDMVYNASNRINTLEADIGAGNAEFYAVNAQFCELKVGAGDADMEGVNLGECNFKVGVGNLDVEGVIGGNVDVSCGVGNVDFELNQNYTEFNYSVKAGLGEVSIGDEDFSAVNNSKIENGADKKMDIQCGLGNVSVEFRP